MFNLLKDIVKRLSLQNSSATEANQEAAGDQLPDHESNEESENKQEAAEDADRRRQPSVPGDDVFEDAEETNHSMDVTLNSETSFEDAAGSDEPIEANSEQDAAEVQPPEPKKRRLTPDEATDQPDIIPVQKRSSTRLAAQVAAQKISSQANVGRKRSKILKMNSNKSLTDVNESSSKIESTEV